MPHIHLETTSDLWENGAIPDILEALVSRLATFETISAPSIKATHSLRSVWAMGMGGRSGYAHCTVSILTGRPPELKRRIADGLYAVMKQCFVESDSTGEASLTLEVREMEADTYRK